MLFHWFSAHVLVIKQKCIPLGEFKKADNREFLRIVLTNPSVDVGNHVYTNQTEN